MNEQQFGKLSANKIFIKCAIPGLLSLLSSSIYVVVDGIFIGKFLGSNALAALNLIFPIITILYAIGDMFAVGSSVKISLALGAGEKDFANRLFSNGVLTMLCINIVITIFGLIFAKPIIFGLIKDTLLAKDTYLYISSFLMFFPLSALLFATDDYLRACGKAKFSMTLNIVVSLLNIILDAIFIGVLKMDIRAAALTTGISTSIGTIISLLPFLFKKLTLRFTVPIVPIKETLNIIYNGSSDFFGKISGSLMGILINSLLMIYGGTIYIASYSIVMYIESFLMCAVFGIISSIQPPISYNVGKKDLKKAMEIFKLSCISTGAICVVCVILFYGFSDAIVSVFTPKEEVEVLNVTKTALFLIAPSYLLAWFNNNVNSCLTSYNKPKESLMLMMLNTVAFPIIGLVVLIPILKENAVFVLPLFSAILTFVVAVFMLKKIND